VESPLTTSQVQDRSASNVDLHGSLNKNWEVLGTEAPIKCSSILVHDKDHDDDIRSDKASDNALQTRLMDDYSEGYPHTSKEIPASSATSISQTHLVGQATEITPEEKLRKAEEQINRAKDLKEQYRPEEALPLLLSSLELLNPDSFNIQDQSLLTEINEKIKECTLEIADCYNQLNDFNQSIKYARAMLKYDPENIRTIYLLAIGLIRIGDLDEAHTILKESKGIVGPSADTIYVNLIDKELEKLDQIADSKSKTPRASSFEDQFQPILVRNTTGSVDEVPEEKQELIPNNPKKHKGEQTSAAEYFLGSLVSTSALSFMVAKYLFKFPTKKGLITSLIVGAVVGGVSLIIQSAIRKNERGKSTKKD